jgi:hypothetical protein
MGIGDNLKKNTNLSLIVEIKVMKEKIEKKESIKEVDQINKKEDIKEAEKKK